MANYQNLKVCTKKIFFFTIKCKTHLIINSINFVFQGFSTFKGVAQAKMCRLFAPTKVDVLAPQGAYSAIEVLTDLGKTAASKVTISNLPDL